MKKLMSMLVLVALVAFGSWCQAEEKVVQTRPGAMVSYYSVPDGGKLSSDSVPLEVSVDTQESWSQKNLRRCPAMEKYSSIVPGCVVWEGFAKFPAKGTYVFSLTRSDGKSASMSLYLNGKRILAGEWESTLITIPEEIMKVRVVLMTYPYWGFHACFDLKYWLKDKPLKKYVLTPAKMIHEE